MNKNIENIDRYLKGVVPPEHTSHQHRQQLRREVLEEIERRQTMSVRVNVWKAAAVLAIVIGAGAIATAVGLSVYQIFYRFEGQDDKGAYHFSTEPQIIYKNYYQDANGAESAFTVTHGHLATVGAADATDAEQARMDLEEIALLRQRDARELIGVTETEVNGHLQTAFRYKYVLSDGRVKTIGEGNRDEDQPRDSTQINADREQIAILRQRGERELTSVVDTQIGDDLYRTCTYKYVLPDGRQTSVGEGDPELAEPATPLTTERIEEIWRLRRFQKGDYLGYEDKQVQGRTFALETYIFTLSDGTVVTHGVGEPKGAKTSLTQKDWDELYNLIQAGAGEDLGVAEKEYKGRAFIFKRQRFVLGDGTEVIWSPGTPKDGQ